MALTEFTTQTPYGDMQVTPAEVRIRASHRQLYDWAHRPGEAWPLSALAGYDQVVAEFDGNGLRDLTIRSSEGGGDEADLSSDELSAWALTVARDRLPTAHPAWLPIVGQFAKPSRD